MMTRRWPEDEPVAPGWFEASTITWMVLSSVLRIRMGAPVVGDSGMIISPALLRARTLLGNAPVTSAGAAKGAGAGGLSVGHTNPAHPSGPRGYWSMLATG
jgi:hypothetical protein